MSVLNNDEYQLLANKVELYLHDAATYFNVELPKEVEYIVYANSTVGVSFIWNNVRLYTSPYALSMTNLQLKALAFKEFINSTNLHGLYPDISTVISDKTSILFIESDNGESLFGGI